MSPQYGLLNNLCFHKTTSFASCPYIEDDRHLSIKGWSSDYAPLRSTFSPSGAMAFCFRAIREFTAAGQSETFTPFPINRG